MKPPFDRFCDKDAEVRELRSKRNRIEEELDEVGERILARKEELREEWERLETESG